MVLFNLLPFFSVIKTNEFIVVLVIILIVSIIILFLRYFLLNFEMNYLNNN
jgi:hypothetical protein